jgi:hypothetical protein
MYALDSVAPTLCRITGVPPIRGATAKPIMEVLRAAKQKCDGKIEKAFLYAPDAIGEALLSDYPTELEHIMRIAPLEVLISSMSPSLTPVCYGSMFTGMKPEEHGITRYHKPILRCDTLFDAYARAGKRVAIVAVKGSSIDTIFRERDIDYYSEPYDPEVERQALQLLQENIHDLILVYHQEYDDAMHRSTPRSPEALKAFRNHQASFKRFGETINDVWSKNNRVIAFLPDHGTHIDPNTGKGSHGTDSPDDMKVRHFWGIYSGSSARRRCP